MVGVHGMIGKRDETGRKGGDNGEAGTGESGADSGG